MVELFLTHWRHAFLIWVAQSLFMADSLKMQAQQLVVGVEVFKLGHRQESMRRPQLPAALRLAGSPDSGEWNKF